MPLHTMVSYMPQSRSSSVQASSLQSPDLLDSGKYDDEAIRIEALLANPVLDAVERRAAATAARDIVVKARAETQHSGVMESFLEEFGLSNPEGLALMCLAEALLLGRDDSPGALPGDHRALVKCTGRVREGLVLEFRRPE